MRLPPGALAGFYTKTAGQEKQAGIPPVSPILGALGGQHQAESPFWGALGGWMGGGLGSGAGVAGGLMLEKVLPKRIAGPVTLASLLLGTGAGGYYGGKLMAGLANRGNE